VSRRNDIHAATSSPCVLMMLICTHSSWMCIPVSRSDQGCPAPGDPMEMAIRTQGIYVASQCLFHMPVVPTQVETPHRWGKWTSLLDCWQPAECLAHSLGKGMLT
jgi:hypothetical protein